MGQQRSMSFCLNVHVYLCACVCFYGFLPLGKEDFWDARGSHMKKTWSSLLDDNDVGVQTKSHKAQKPKI